MAAYLEIHEERFDVLAADGRDVARHPCAVEEVAELLDSLGVGDHRRPGLVLGPQVARERVEFGSNARMCRLGRGLCHCVPRFLWTLPVQRLCAVLAMD